jgi:ABC-type sugar transport system ATPase subunit
MDEPVVELIDITKTFPGVRALSSVSLKLMPGEVHALVGANGAGKSTLIGVLSGAHVADSGIVRIQGRDVEHPVPAVMQQLGIRTVYQERSLIVDISVAENIMRDALPVHSGGWVSWRQMNREAAKLLEWVGLEIEPSTLVRQLGSAEQQMVEIAQAVRIDSTAIILDEPTASIGRSETERLFAVVRRLRARRIPALFISHHLDEVFSIADRVTVLRDGETVFSAPIAATNHAELVQHVAGRALQVSSRERRSGERVEILRCEDLVSQPAVQGVSFSAYSGEVAVITGMVGAGRSELLQAIYGARSLDSGQIWVRDSPVGQDNTPRKSLDRGIAFVPEERQTDGIIPELSVRYNISASVLQRVQTWGLISKSKEAALTASHVSRLGVKAAHDRVAVKTLSGGNQQKVVLARVLAVGPDLLLLDEPTKGVDVGAKAEIYQVIDQMAKDGAAVVVVSSDIEEVMALADRVLVMRRGRIAAEFDPRLSSEKEVIHASVADIE